mmetsp:Transcript_24313/g.32819  ORF Transcript_24313/g.32819 Transcript_24313/m.32819 type:complete len:95 (+) Transcript_24313:2-286(+)
MRPYVELAEKHGYEVRFQDALEAGGGSVTLDVLKQRCATRERADGKQIPEAALERILKRHERLPAGAEEAKAEILKAEPPARQPRAKPAATEGR